MQDLHELPKLRDSLSYLYTEHAVIDRKDSAIELIQQTGRTLAPVANLCVLMLGPGTSVTHAAIKLLAENGCTVLWTGEDAMRCYAQGTGETRKGYHLVRQASLATRDDLREQVALRMYRKRFAEILEPGLSLPQIRGMEGVRMRTAYSRASRQYNVAWNGRRYDTANWGKGDPINRALSAANALLNGICHSAIVSGGYSPGIGFIHTGRQLSFVYDIADLYKTELTIPLAFKIVGESPHNVESRVRQACRELFHTSKLLSRLLPDIDEVLGIPADYGMSFGDPDSAAGEPVELWEALWAGEEG